jgi:hypothetical protein
VLQVNGTLSEHAALPLAPLRTHRVSDLNSQNVAQYHKRRGDARHLRSPSRRRLVEDGIMVWT